MSNGDVMAFRRLHDFWQGMVELGRVQWVNGDREIAEAVMAEARDALGRMEGRAGSAIHTRSLRKSSC